MAASEKGRKEGRERAREASSQKRSVWRSRFLKRKEAWKTPIVISEKGRVVPEGGREKEEEKEEE